MKKTILNKVLLGSMAVLLFSCNSGKEQPVTAGAGTEPIAIDKEKIKEEIQEREDEFASIYNSGELKSIGYYADDAVTFFQNRPPLVGKEAIVAFLKADLTNANKILFKTNEVFPSSDGNQVVELGNFKVIDPTNTVINTGNYMSLFEKRNGKYVCLRDMSASVMPTE
jgi:ketosteroid isomerase-like protein